MRATRVMLLASASPPAARLAAALLLATVVPANAAARAVPRRDRTHQRHEAARGQDDALDVLWQHRLDLAEGGAPRVTIRLVEGQHAIVFRSASRASLRLREGRTLDVAAGQVLRVVAASALPAALVHHPLLAEAPWSERGRLDEVRRRWERRGVEVRQRITGAVYGIRGRVIDNRRVVLLAAGGGSEAAARDFADRALALDGSRTGTFTEALARPSGRLVVADGRGRQLGSADSLVTLDAEAGAAFELLRPSTGSRRAEGRSEGRYRGRLHVTVDASGRLAAVLSLPLEELLRGLVPSEIPAGAPGEALKAQSVTARSNVLAQIGTRHLTDPYVLCSDVHCQAYRGAAVQTPATDAAVRATAGEVLFGTEDHRLVDAVYSAVCGGHGEDNDMVWPTLPDPRLRGHPDLPVHDAAAWAGGLAEEERLRAFLEAGPRGWCGRAAGLPSDRYRWERRIPSATLDALASDLGVGAFRALEVTSRGVSGRARALSVAGEGGRAVIEGELRIRRLLGNLPSAMFVIDQAVEGLLLRGGGWGHGAGMCQWGAIGRAQAGQGYLEILRAYYAGADTARVY